MISPAGKIKTLQGRIKSGQPWAPKVGDLIYVPTRLYLDHGRDDVEGGLATITEVELRPEYTQSGNDIFVGVEEIPGRLNFRSLLQAQPEHQKRYGKRFAYPDPDERERFNRP